MLHHKGAKKLGGHCCGGMKITDAGDALPAAAGREELNFLAPHEKRERRAHSSHSSKNQ